MRTKSGILFMILFGIVQLNVSASDPVNFVLGGTFNIEYSKGDGSGKETFGAGVLPQFGVRVYNVVELGVGLGYSFSNGYFEDFNPRTINNTQGYYSYDDQKSISRLTNTYFKSFLIRRERIKFFLGVEYNTEKGYYEYSYRDNYNSNTYKYDFKAFSTGLISGINYSLSNKIELMCSFGLFSYGQYKIETDNQEPYKHEEVNFLLDFDNVNFGIRFVL